MLSRTSGVSVMYLLPLWYFRRNFAPAVQSLHVLIATMVLLCRPGSVPGFVYL